MKKTHLVAGFLLVPLALLSGCGKDAPPAEYAYGETKLPALQEVAEVDEEELSFSENSDEETETTAYVYADLESGSNVAAQYVTYLTEQEGCSVITPDGEMLKNTEITEDSGTTYVGYQQEEGSGVFLLEITWDETSCTVTPEFKPDLTIFDPAEGRESLSLNDIVDRMMSYSPGKLGLSGNSMRDYSVFPEEGYVLVNNTPGIKVNVYDPSTHSFQATYIISFDGTALFRCDRSTNQVTELEMY